MRAYIRARKGIQPETQASAAFLTRIYTNRSQKQLRLIRAKTRKFTGAVFAEKLEDFTNFAPDLRYLGERLLLPRD